MNSEGIGMENTLKTGTTTLAMRCADGIVVAADRRATAGTLIVNKGVTKIQPISDRIIVTMAGTVSDAQLLIKLTQATLRLNKVRIGKEASVKEAANLLAGMVYSNIRKMSMIPGIAHFIISGTDDLGFHIFDCYPDGSLTECDDYLTSGSGSVMVLGVLETLYKKEMKVEEGIKIAVKSMNAALQRDCASGSGFDIMAITKDGIKKVYEKDLTGRIE
jgi:proteasome beta subunit